MQILATQKEGRAARMRRHFLLWAFSTALAAVALTMVPGLAYADDTDATDVPLGALTLIDDSSDEQYAVVDETPEAPAVETVEVVEAPAAADSSEDSSDITDEHDSVVVVEETPKTDITDSSDEETIAPTDEDAIDNDDITLHDNDPPSDSDDSSEKELSADESNPSTNASDVQENKSENSDGSKDSQTSADEETPASTIVVPETSPTSSNDSVEEVKSSADIKRTEVAKDSNENIQKASIQTNSDELETASDITIQTLPVTLTIYLRTGWLATDSKTYNATTVHAVGPADDYIYDSSFNRITGSSIPVTFSAGDKFPVFYRYGYALAGYVKHQTLNSNGNQSYAAYTYSGTQLSIGTYFNAPATYEIYLIWNQTATYQYDFTYSNGGSNSSDKKSGQTLDQDLVVPSKYHSVSDTNISGAHGWYWSGDVNPADTSNAQDQFTLSNPSATAFTSSDSVWDLMKYVLDIKDSDQYSAAKYTQFISYTATTPIMLYAAATSASTPDEKYTVNYYKADYSGINNTDTPKVADAATDSAKSNTALSPQVTKTNYDFGGWANSVANATAGNVYIAAGAKFSTLGAAIVKGAVINLYPIWIAHTYTVNFYNADYSAVNSTDTLNVDDKATDAAKTNTALSPQVTKAGYTFGGWANSIANANNKQVYIAAGAKFSTLTAATKGNTINLYPIWNAETYKVNYYKADYSGINSTDTLDVANATSDKAKSNTEVSPQITRTGYTFGGWADSAANAAAGTVYLAAGAAFSTKSPAANGTINLYPIWTAKTYDIIWAERYTGTTPLSVSGTDYFTTTQITYGSSTTIASQKPTSPAVGDDVTVAPYQYTFQGWYLTRGSASTNWDTPTTGGTVLGTQTLAAALGTSGVVKDDTNGKLYVWAIWTKAGAINVEYNDNKSSIYDYKGTSADPSTTTSPSTWNKGTSGSFHTDTPFQGTTYTVYGSTPAATGYSFKEWRTNANGTGTVYNPGDTITNIQTTTLYAVYTPNSVTFSLNPNTTETVTMNAKTTMPTKAVGQTLSIGDLVSATPVRAGYTFKGFQGSYADGTTTVTFDVTSGQTANITPALAAVDGATITLVAQWEQIQYAVKYHKNEFSSDTENSVTFKDATSGATRSDGYSVTTLPDGTTKIVSNTKNLDTAGNLYNTATTTSVSYGNTTYGNLYKFEGWGLSASATVASKISAATDFITLYNQQLSAGGTDDNELDLYAIWTPITIGISYVSADTAKGTVSPSSESSVNLATGSTSGSTATANAGYELANPSWRYNDGSTITEVSSALALYKPSLAELRDRYFNHNETSVTYKAYFTEASYAYTVQYYLQKADGTWATTADQTKSAYGTYNTKATYGSSVSSSFVIPSGSASGTKLEDWILTSQTTGSVSNQDLYDFDSTNALGVTTISSISDTVANNVLKLYYTRKTYDLTASYATSNGTTTTAGAPSSVTTTAASELGKTTGIRWGEAVSVGSPAAGSYPGYTFAWSVKTPSGATSAAPGTTFALSADDMAALGSNTAELLGTFSEKTYTITLNAGANAEGGSWSTSGGAASLGGAGTYASKSVYTSEALGTWVPTSSDSSSNTYYFLGWHDDKDTANPTSTVTTAWLQAHTGWTDNESYTGLWKEKVTISYQSGDLDSHGNTKAGWVSTSIKISDSLSNLALGSSTGNFNTVVGSLDTNGDPLGANGWEFDFWEIVGDSAKYGHHAALPSGAGISTSYHDGGWNAGGIAVTGNMTLIAHWKAVAQTVTMNNSGMVSNNASQYTPGTDNLSVSTTGTGKSYGADATGYGYDDVLDLADYAPTDTPAGYSFIGWTTTANGTTVDYGPTATLRVPLGGVSLYPVFDEDSFTIEYKLAADSAGAGTISGGTDTVYAVKLNSITSHTATAYNTTKHHFAGWTLDADPTVTAANEAGTSFESTNSTFTSGLTAPLTANHTYYAHFVVNQYKIKFDVDGYDGTNGSTMPQTSTWDAAVVSATYDAGSNDIELDYDATIPNGSVSVSVPTGYVLSGWIVDGNTSDVKTWGTPTAANLQGLWSYLVDGDHTLTPYFTVDTVANFTVNYDYGVAPATGRQTSRSVTWTDVVTPTASTDSYPTTPGYTFAGWYIDPAFTVSATASGTDQFNEIYTYGAPAVTGTESITIYAKWTAKSFTVAYDVEGNVAYTGSATATPATISPVTVQWDTTAGNFIPTGTITRPGYTLSGWYSTVHSGSSELATSGGNAIATTDTYGKLADNYNDSYTTVTLHAIWTAQTYQVKYIDIDGAGASFSAYRPYDTDLNYYLGYAATARTSAPSRSGYTFDGWAISYNKTDGTTGTPAFSKIDSTNPVTSIKAIVNDGDFATPINLTAIWVQESAYYFHDVLVHRDGTESVQTADGPHTLAGTYTVSYGSYTAPTTPYDGYDFDNFLQVLPTHAAHTESSMTVSPGDMSFDYNVYYIERAYNIDFYNEKSSIGTSAANYSSTDNPWESALATLPGTDPTKTGYTFKGWYVDVAGTPVLLSGKSIKQVLATAPANGTTLEAYALWDEDKATISWAAGAHGSVTPADGSVQRDATDATAVASITATPDTNYVFDKWTYEYTDADGNTQTGTVSSSSPFATLSDFDGTSAYLTLTPKQWTMGSETAAIWHDIKFTANFKASDAITVTIRHYVENPNTGGWDLTTTTDTANNGVAYTAAPDTTFTSNGYTLSPSTSTAYGAYKDTDTVDPAVASTLEYILYYTADPHTVSYQYVLAIDGSTPQAAPTGAAALPAGGTYKTGQDFTVASVPAALAGYTFSGWYLKPNYGGYNPTYDNVTYTMGASDLVFVGTWTRNVYTVHFGNTDTTSGSVVEPAAGFSVAEGDTLSSTYSASALTDLPVTVTAVAGNTLSGWEVYEDGTLVTTIAATAPLSYTISTNTLFKAKWAETWDVQYGRGQHGTFTDAAGTQAYVEYARIADNAYFSTVPYNGTTDSGKPNAAAGWEWVGWGEQIAGTWTYYFAYDADVDYDDGTGITVANYGAGSTLPAQVTRNYTLVGFYKALPNTLVFADTQDDGSIWDLDSDGVNDVSKTLAASDYTATVKTGEKPALLGAGSLSRTGYTLKQWMYNDGTNTYYYNVGTTDFTMPGLASGSTVTLFPVWELDQLTITYDVDPASATSGSTWGGVSNTSDSKSTETDTVSGSIANAKPGYKFDYWYKGVSATDSTEDTSFARVTSASFVPTASGAYYAHFSEKTYEFDKEKGDDATNPVWEDASNPSDPNNWSNIAPSTPASGQVWTDGVTLGTPKRSGFSFGGWDVYGLEADGTTRTLLHSALGAGSYSISDLADAAGDYQKLILVATWADLTYTVTIDDGHGTGSDNVSIDAGPYASLPDTSTVNYTDEITLPTLSRPGYTFAGWSNSAVSTWTTSDGLHYYELVAGDGDITTVTLTALWTPNSVYNVTYSDGSHTGQSFTGTLPTDRTNIGFDEADVKRTDLTGGVAGYTFDGWVVTNDADGSVLATITSGYATDAVYSALVGGDASITNITFTAQWSAEPQQVMYHLTNGSWDTTYITDAGKATPNAAIATSTGDTVSLRNASTVSYEGYQLKGWATSTNPSDPDYVEYLFSAGATSFTMPAGSVDLYPLWDPAKFEVKFVDMPTSDTDAANAVSGLPADDNDVQYAAALTIAAPTRTGYTFTGWDVYKTADYALDPTAASAIATGLGAGAASYSTTYGTLAGSASVLSLTFVATWTPTGYYVTYSVASSLGADWVTSNITDAGAATPNNAFSAVTGATVDLRQANTLSRKGYKLTGWEAYYIDPSTTPATTSFWKNFDLTLPETSFTMPASNVILYPIWAEKDDYSVTFDDGVAGLTLPTGVTGASNMPADKSGLKWYDNVDTHQPSLAGYTWKGWKVLDSDGGVVANTDVSPLNGPTYQFNVLAGNSDAANHKDLKLVAIWQLDESYDVQFADGVLAGETPVTWLPSDLTGIAYVDSVAHTAPTRTGYTFDGWSVVATDITGATTTLADLAAGTTAYDAIANDPKIKKLELTAKWSVKTGYAVKFVDKPASDTGATAVAGLPASLTGLGWDAYFSAVAPTRAGYTFDHWAVQNTTDPANVINIGQATSGSYYYNGEKDASGTYIGLAVNPSTGLGDDSIMELTLTAVWVANRWDVTYHLTDTTAGTWVTTAPSWPDTGAATPDAAITYTVDTTVALRGAATVTISGYKLVGWANGTDDTAAGYKAYKFAEGATSFDMPDNDVDLYPLFEAKTYTVVFDGNKPAAATDATQVVTITQANPQSGLEWTDSVDTAAATLPGYNFLGWRIKDAAGTGANTALLTDAAYAFDALALTDTADHETLTLVAIWEASTYRLIYVDDTPEVGGTAVATQIENADSVLWGDAVSQDDPWTLVTPAYAGKDSADWAFVGWSLVDAASGLRVTIAATDDLSFAALAARAGLTVADIATSSDTPALTLYAVWTRRVPFVVDFVTVDTDGTTAIESSVDLTGLDQDDIASVWAAHVLGLGSGHAIAGYSFDAAASAATTEITTGILDALTQLAAAGGTPLHIQLLYSQLLDYVVTYDGNGGKLWSDGTTTKNGPAPAWNSTSDGFAPVDSDWHRTGYSIDHWYYVAADGSQVTFAASTSLTFAQIAAAIYGTTDGSEGHADEAGAIARPVTLYAYWTPKTNYSVGYDDGYDVIDDKFLDVVGENPYTPDDLENVGWTEENLDPETGSLIVSPGVENGDGTETELYTLDGWDYVNSKGERVASEGKSFAEIAYDIYGEDEPENAKIELIARWRENEMTLTYTAVVIDENGNVTTMNAGGTVNDAAGATHTSFSEAISAVTGTADGASATAAPGYHFVGWQRKNADGTYTTIYAPGMDPSTLSAASVSRLFAAADAAGVNVMSLDSDDVSVLVAQSDADGYWHSEEYFALFAANDIAILHYDKNAEDATGTIADVSAPFGSLLTLSDGSAFKRANWKLVAWNTEADGSGTTYALSEANWPLPEGETTLYAMWERLQATLTYDGNATGVTNVPASVTDEWGTELTVSSQIPVRAHYTFLGWNTERDGSGTSYAGGDLLTLPAEGETLYAMWEIVSYEIEVGEPGEGGTVSISEPIDVPWGGYLPEGTLTATPEDGYVLKEWTYTIVGEDGRVITGTTTDPSKVRITGKVTFTPVFEKLPTEDEPEPATASATKASELAVGAIPQTGDEGMNVAPLVAAGTALLLLAVALRRREDDEEA